MILTASGNNITDAVGSISLESNVDTLGDHLSFDIAYAEPYVMPTVNVGDLIQLFDNKEVFRGIVVTKTRNTATQNFDCFDFAFYLNKSKTTKQFKKVRADDAITQLLAQFSVPIGHIAPLPLVITKICYDKEVSAVIKEVLEDVASTTGAKYIMEMNAGKFEIHADTERIVKATVRLADNLAALDCMLTVSEPTKTASIEDMKNSVKVYVGDENGVKVYAHAQDEVLIGRYGLLQETQSLTDKDIAQARNIAQNLLSELGRVAETANVTVLGSFDLRAGRVAEINEPMTNIVGRFKILSASHSIGAVHTTTLELGMV